MNVNKYIFCAIDFKYIEQVEKIISTIKDHIGGIKIGLEFFIFNGPKEVIRLKKFKLPIFLDLKFLDIPNTVSQAILSTEIIEPEYLSVHLSGGRKMLEEISRIKNKKTKIIGVTMLTSMDRIDLKNLSINQAPEEYVYSLVNLAIKNNLEGIVCSPQELVYLKKKSVNDLIYITPGIRLKKSKDDQKRTLTPGEAIKNGADILIIGRPITQSKNPVQAINKIKNDIKAKLKLNLDEN